MDPRCREGGNLSLIPEVQVGNSRLICGLQATFRTLAASQYWRNCDHGQGIIVTVSTPPRDQHREQYTNHFVKGKGYADLATLEFLNLIHALRPTLPILCVVDCDPHGIDIMRTYKYGSRSLSHEENATVPDLQWLGVKMEDILRHISRPQEEDSPQSSADLFGQSTTGHSGSQGSNSFVIPSEPLVYSFVYCLRTELTGSQHHNATYDRDHDDPGVPPTR